jgi:soluble lytic murein transglycosylase-like protein
VKLSLAILTACAAVLAQTAPQQAPTPAKPASTFQSSIQQQRAAMVVQRESVRKQAEMAAEWRGAVTTSSTASPSSLPQASPDCEPITPTDAAPLIDAAAEASHVQAKLLRVVIEQESGYRPCAESAKGARGLMQLMPATMDDLGVADPFDAKQNIEAGARYLKQLIDRYKGDLSLALAAFNAGPGKVDDAGGIPDIQETKDYVESILKKVR